jgi:hypothetical protein
MQGTFYDLPEGSQGILSDCWDSIERTPPPMRIHYAAHGNDLTVTRLIRTTMTFMKVESDPQTGDLIHLVARMSLGDALASPPTRQQAEFYDGDRLLGKADLSGEYAYLNWTDAAPGPHQIHSRYPGDEFYQEAASAVTSFSLGKSLLLPYINR